MSEEYETAPVIIEKEIEMRKRLKQCMINLNELCENFEEALSYKPKSKIGVDVDYYDFCIHESMCVLFSYLKNFHYELGSSTVIAMENNIDH